MFVPAHVPTGTFSEAWVDTFKTFQLQIHGPFLLPRSHPSLPSSLISVKLSIPAVIQWSPINQNGCREIAQMKVH